MKIKKLTDAYLIRLERGEELIASLIEFANSEQVKGGFLHGLGGAESASIGIYKIDTDKQYHFTDFEEELEVISLNGNIATDADDQVMVHCHATISGADLKTFGGHVKKMVIAGTCEIFVDTRTGPLSRVMDDSIGLKLLDI